MSDAQLPVQDNESNATSAPGKVVSGPRKKSVAYVISAVIVGLLIVGGATYLTARALYGSETKEITQSQTTQQPGISEISNNGFMPSTMKIGIGQSVTWKNTTQSSQTLQVAQEPALFPATELEPEEELTYAFSVAGTFDFSLASGATQQIIVE